jgi:hypothetical protein
MFLTTPYGHFEISTTLKHYYRKQEGRRTGRASPFSHLTLQIKERRARTRVSDYLVKRDEHMSSASPITGWKKRETPPLLTVPPGIIDDCQIYALSTTTCRGGGRQCHLHHVIVVREEAGDSGSET